MKAYVEIIKLNLENVVTSSPCGAEYTPELTPGCNNPILE